MDISTYKLAWVWLDEGAIGDFGVVSSKDKTADGRLWALQDQLDEILDVTDDTTIWIEGLPFVRNRKGFSSISQVLGMLKAECWRRGLSVQVVPGYDWKKQLGMKGNAPKAVIAQAMPAIVNAYDDPDNPFADRILSDQDLMDALGVAVYGAAH